MVTQELELQSSYLALGWSQAREIAFGSSQLGDGALQEDFGLFCFRIVCLDPLLKIRSVSYTHLTLPTIYSV